VTGAAAFRGGEALGGLLLAERLPAGFLDWAYGFGANGEVAVGALGNEEREGKRRVDCSWRLGAIGVTTRTCLVFACQLPRVT